jgi:hypothetical protein
VTKKPAANAMFPGGEDTPLISGTPIDAKAVDVAPGDSLPISAATLDQLPVGDQAGMFDNQLSAFDPTAIAGTLSNGTWSVVESRALVSGYAYQIKTATVRGPVYPVALAVTPADAAVLAQAKRLLALVVRAYSVPADKIADPAWDAFRREAQLVLQDCAMIPKTA